MCPNHPDRPVKTRGLCGSCYGKWLYNSNPEFRERQRQNAKSYYDNNKDYFYEQNKKNRLEKPEQYKAMIRKYQLKKYGLTETDYENMLEQQGNKCAICNGSDFGEKGPTIDHCHTTGQVRGILCGKCNKGIGLLNDDISIMNNAIDYLQNSKINLVKT